MGDKFLLRSVTIMNNLPLHILNHRTSHTHNCPIQRNYETCSIDPTKAPTPARKNQFAARTTTVFSPPLFISGDRAKNQNRAHCLFTHTFPRQRARARNPYRSRMGFRPSDKYRQLFGQMWKKFCA